MSADEWARPATVGRTGANTDASLVDEDPVIRCEHCGTTACALDFRCRRCGGTVELMFRPAAGHATGGPAAGNQGLWGYLHLLPVDRVVTLGEPTTPLIEIPWLTATVHAKLEGSLPTGSFKDRGAAVSVAWLSRHGASGLVIDSSGNAGAALAAYSARAGMDCHVYAPAAASPAKLMQVSAYGAVLHSVSGSRQDVASAAMAHETGDGMVYAGHGYTPAFLYGTATLAYELVDQLGGQAPEVVVVPVGAGTLLLGLVQGFEQLRDLHRIEQTPRVFGVQSDQCAPLAVASASGATEPASVVPGRTLAEGIRIAAPPRGRKILQAVRTHGGSIVKVPDSEVVSAHQKLSANGVFGEPTSAVAMAGLTRLLASGSVRAHQRIVVPITGNGLKAGLPQ